MTEAGHSPAFARAGARFLKLGHQHSPEPTGDINSPSSDRVINPRHGLPQNQSNESPHDLRAETVAAPRTVLSQGSYRGTAILVSHDSPASASRDPETPTQTSKLVAPFKRPCQSDLPEDKSR
jgi:hypothetical protein